MSRAIMEFDLSDPASKEQHEHAADGFRYYKVLEDLAKEMRNNKGDYYLHLMATLGRKHSVPRIRTVAQEVACGRDL